MNHTTCSRVAAGLLFLFGLGAPLLACDRSDPTDRAAECRLHWRRKTFEPGAWPEELPEAARALVEEWTPLARQLGYRMDLTEDARVLTLSAARFNRSVKREDGLVRDTLEAFDAWVPAVAGGPSFERPVVLLRLHDGDDYRACLAHLAERHPYLSPWAGSATDLSGFVLRQPLCAAWIERYDGAQEWRPRNELVNRLTNCLTYARFGEPPHWLGQGLAWHLELGVCKSIYCFPDRNGFVSIDEHRGWEQLLKQTYSRRGGLVLACTDLATWNAGQWDELQAGLAWGLVGFLLEHHPGTLGPVLRDLGHYRAEHGRVVHEDGSWELVPGYQVPVGVQEHVLRRHLGADLFAECTSYFQQGSRYRPRPHAR